MPESLEQYYGTGRRKASVARVYIRPGEGKIEINERSLDTYFHRPTSRFLVMEPLVITKSEKKFDIKVNVCGGGEMGQAGAIKHGIARALCQFDLDMRPPLKKAGFLMRDARVKERKKYGQPGARKRFQYSKR